MEVMCCAGDTANLTGREVRSYSQHRTERFTVPAATPSAPLLGTLIQGRNQMNMKILGAFAAVALLAACANTETGASSGAGAQAAQSGAVPGSQEDLVANVGDRVFYD